MNRRLTRQRMLLLTAALMAVVNINAIAATTAITEEELASDTSSVALTYDAYIAGINSGVAELTVSKSAVAVDGLERYEVSGVARSKGLWESIQKWRAEYSIDGVVRVAEDHRTVEPGHFYSLQTTPKKRREIHIEGGILKEIKNLKVRDPRPAQTGFDLLSALFFLPACDPEVRVHTGRDGYDMRQIESSGALQCHYEVTDEDGGRYEMSLEYVYREALPAAPEAVSTATPFLVPAVIKVQGPLSGRLVLANEP